MMSLRLSIQLKKTAIKISKKTINQFNRLIVCFNALTFYLDIDSFRHYFEGFDQELEFEVEWLCNLDLRFQ